MRTTRTAGLILLRVSGPPTHQHPSTDKASNPYQLKYTQKRARFIASPFLFFTLYLCLNVTQEEAPHLYQF